MVIVRLIYDYKCQLKGYWPETSVFGLNLIKFVGHNQFIVWFASVLRWKKGAIDQVVKKVRFFDKTKFWQSLLYIFTGRKRN